MLGILKGTQMDEVLSVRQQELSLQLCFCALRNVFIFFAWQPWCVFHVPLFLFDSVFQW